jgi:hypothetical protein
LGSYPRAVRTVNLHSAVLTPDLDHWLVRGKVMDMALGR